MRSLPVVALGALALIAAGQAEADPITVAARPTAARPARPPGRHALYLELLGRGSLWGAGYDYQATAHLSFGALGSWFSARGEQVTSVAPYLGVYPFGAGRHRLMLQLGPLVVHKRTPSPVPEWDGATDTGVAGQLTVGYEYRGPVLVRGFAMGSAGKGGAYPWLGASLGWTF